MKLLFKQRAFLCIDRYDVYDESENVIYTIEEQPSWGSCLHILDAAGQHIGTVRRKLMRLLPCFELFEKDERIDTMQKKMSLLKPYYALDSSGWTVEGNFFEWNYRIAGRNGSTVASANKELLHWGDTYTIDVTDPRDALRVLMIVLALDAEKGSRD